MQPKSLSPAEWDTICIGIRQGVSARLLASDHGVSHTWLNKRLPAELAARQPKQRRTRRPRHVVAK
jgi:hypothetical protein